MSIKLAPGAQVEQIQPTEVRLFITVSTCSGQPVTNLTGADFELLEDGAPVSLFESRQTIDRTPQAFRVYSLLTLDTSGSIIESNSLQPMQTAASTFAAYLIGLGPEEFVSVRWFDGAPETVAVAPFVSDLAVLNNGILSMSTKNCSTGADCQNPLRRDCVVGSDTALCRDSSTDLYGATIESLSLLQQAIDGDKTPYKVGSVTVLTDGTDQAGRHKLTDVVQAVTGTSNFVFSIGLGGETDMAVLSNIGKTGTASASDASQLNNALNSIAMSIHDQANRFYLLEYCSPKRQGAHDLTVRLRDDKFHGALKVTFDATGFTSGCPLP